MSLTYHLVSGGVKRAVLVVTNVYPDSLAEPGPIVNPRNKDDAKVSRVIECTTEQNLGDLVVGHANFNDLKATKGDEGRELDAPVAVLKRLLASVLTVVDTDTLLRLLKALREADFEVVQKLVHVLPSSFGGCSRLLMTKLLCRVRLVKHPHEEKSGPNHTHHDSHVL